MIVSMECWSGQYPGRSVHRLTMCSFHSANHIMEKLNTHSKNKSHPIAEIITDGKLAYGPVHHGYIKIISKGMADEDLVKNSGIGT